MSSINEKKFDLIITVINKGFSDYVIDIARSAGASGATIINARGTGVHETDTIFGINIQPEKEVVLILVFKEEREKIMNEICSQAHLDEPGKGLCFSVPVNDVEGINYLIKKNKIAKKQNRKKKTEE